MYVQEKQIIYGVWYHKWFQASPGGLGTYAVAQKGPLDVTNARRKGYRPLSPQTEITLGKKYTYVLRMLGFCFSTLEYFQPVLLVKKIGLGIRMPCASVLTLSPICTVLQENYKTSLSLFSLLKMRMVSLMLLGLI